MQNIKKKYQIIALIILVLSMFRGVVSLLIGDFIETKYIYHSISSIFLLYAVFWFFTKYRRMLPLQLKNLLYLNLLVYVYWLITDLMLFSGDIVYFFTYAIFPFFLIPFSRVDRETYVKVFYIISFFVSCSIIFDYLLINTTVFANGYEIREILRHSLTSDSHAPTHTNGVYRAVGIIGDEHEAASLLIMMSAFLYSIKDGVFHPIFKYLCLVFVWLSLFLTYSAANIIVGLVSVIIITVYKINKSQSPIKFFGIFITIIAMLNISFSYNLFQINDIIQPFLVRLDNDEAWEVMLSQRININIFSELVALSVGHVQGVGVSEFGLISEVGLIRILYNSSIFMFLFTFLICIYPIFIYAKVNDAVRTHMFPYIASLYSGLLTLVHYGTLFRSTNIILFFSIYGVLINLYLSSKSVTNSNQLLTPKSIKNTA